VTKAIFRDENGYFDTEPLYIGYPLHERTNVFGSNLPAVKPLKEAVEVWEAKRACTFNGQFFGRAALAQRFKIMVLIPAVATVLALAVGIGVTNASTF
jgi:hypothetical protein